MKVLLESYNIAIDYEVYLEAVGIHKKAKIDMEGAHSPPLVPV